MKILTAPIIKRKDHQRIGHKLNFTDCTAVPFVTRMI